MDLYGGQCVSFSWICDLFHAILSLNRLVSLPHYLFLRNLQVNNINGCCEWNVSKQQWWLHSENSDLVQQTSLSLSVKFGDGRNTKVSILITLSFFDGPVVGLLKVSNNNIRNYLLHPVITLQSNASCNRSTLYCIFHIMAAFEHLLWPPLLCMYCIFHTIAAFEPRPCPTVSHQPWLYIQILPWATGSATIHMYLICQEHRTDYWLC